MSYKNWLQKGLRKQGMKISKKDARNLYKEITKEMDLIMDIYANGGSILNSVIAPAYYQHPLDISSLSKIKKVAKREGVIHSIMKSSKDSEIPLKRVFSQEIMRTELRGYEYVKVGRLKSLISVELLLNYEGEINVLNYKGKININEGNLKKIMDAKGGQRLGEVGGLVLDPILIDVKVEDVKPIAEYLYTIYVIKYYLKAEGDPKKLVNGVVGKQISDYINGKTPAEIKDAKLTRGIHEMVSYKMIYENKD